MSIDSGLLELLGWLPEDSYTGIPSKARRIICTNNHPTVDPGSAAFVGSASVGGTNTTWSGSSLSVTADSSSTGYIDITNPFDTRVLHCSLRFFWDATFLISFYRTGPATNPATILDAGVLTANWSAYPFVYAYGGTPPAFPSSIRLMTAGYTGKAEIREFQGYEGSTVPGVRRDAWAASPTFSKTVQLDVQPRKTVRLHQSVSATFSCTGLSVGSVPAAPSLFVRGIAVAYGSTD